MIRRCSVGDSVVMVVNDVVKCFVLVWLCDGNGIVLVYRN